ncbi:MAG: xanthine dehydrogenase family protein subunit M [Acidimicrobiales bacterium]|jgi:carbon-monoxide dehydrogenase medium subunit|nr:carbon monoxide dehydrogenase [Acidimicrobiaceae bacterium]MDP6077542.1 xanthine dehydrogenase family protein subunit M [Acidimicrobiales bacterium]MDP7258713.1 xanthine dehydrogenase family protein subunit M [Acidimicrobiales bacterium]HCV37033.1 carbon monoxide dehydrogenase [Acidimicrobiaceae bacterium]HJO79303.1 xanthine dehydrogenase family protein subunit M [Acidimicrobiales bacterium]|tara:strand:- start:11497 stop:12312 length:816 start_codon:yes stop_codon:yes gene_type:complete
MIPAAVGYVRADSTEEAVAALREHGDEAKLLAGGQSLIPLMRLRLARPGLLVDMGRADDLRGISVDGDTVSIGALTSHSDLEHSAELAEVCPLLAHVASQIGDPAVRHRGTLGGSLVHADPASDLPAAVLALGGTLVATGPDGSREIEVSDFFTGFLESALAADEVLIAVRIPISTGGWSYQKFNRRAQDWAIVGVAVAESGAGVSLVNMGSTPLRASAVEAAVAGGAGVSDAASVAADGTEPPSDNNADASYREHLARVLTERALVDAGA